MGVLEQRVAIVSGGARGQGLAHAQRFVAEGASVVIIDLLAEEGERAAGELGEAARFVCGNVADAMCWAEAVETAVSAFGGLDILVNNAGKHVNRSFDDTDEAVFRSMLDNNLMGAFLGTRAVVPEMRRRGGGAIVNISSASGFKAIMMSTGYVTAKFAVRGLTRATALELADDGIRVNCVGPGLIRTEMSRALLKWHADDVLPKIPLKRAAEPEEVSELVLFLVSDASRYITGGEYLIDGGSLA
ncbi:MAG: SDR family NAD(P)-dependent oxidoreductase [Acidimicrobiia bacterium]